MPKYGSVPKVSYGDSSSLGYQSDDDETEVAITDALRHAPSNNSGNDEAAPLLLGKKDKAKGSAKTNGATSSPEDQDFLHQLQATLRDTWSKCVAYLQALFQTIRSHEIWSSITAFLQSCWQTMCSAYATTLAAVKDSYAKMTSYLADTLEHLHTVLENNTFYATLQVLWSNLVFNWFTPVLYRGNDKKKLDPEDMELVPFPESCDTQHVGDTFRYYWERELRGRKEGVAEEGEEDGGSTHGSPKKKPSLTRALMYSFGREFATAGLLKLIHDCCIFVGPQVLNAMIYYLRDAEAPKGQGLGLTTLVTLSQLCMSFCLRHYFFSCYMVGLKIRTAVVVVVYQKALLLAAGERQTRTVGEITNLMSIDAKRLQGMLLIYLK